MWRLEIRAFQTFSKNSKGVRVAKVWWASRQVVGAEVGELGGSEGERLTGYWLLLRVRWEATAWFSAEAMTSSNLQSQRITLADIFRELKQGNSEEAVALMLMRRWRLGSRWTCEVQWMHGTLLRSPSEMKDLFLLQQGGLQLIAFGCQPSLKIAPSEESHLAQWPCPFLGSLHSVTTGEEV